MTVYIYIYIYRHDSLTNTHHTRIQIFSNFEAFVATICDGLSNKLFLIFIPESFIILFHCKNITMMNHRDSNVSHSNVSAWNRCYLVIIYVKPKRAAISIRYGVSHNIENHKNHHNIMILFVISKNFRTQN